MFFIKISRAAAVIGLVLTIGMLLFTACAASSHQPVIKSVAPGERSLIYQIPQDETLKDSNWSVSATIAIPTDGCTQKTVGNFAVAIWVELVSSNSLLYKMTVTRIGCGGDWIITYQAGRKVQAFDQQPDLAADKRITLMVGYKPNEGYISSGNVGNGAFLSPKAGVAGDYPIQARFGVEAPLDINGDATDPLPGLGSIDFTDCSVNGMGLSAYPTVERSLSPRWKDQPPLGADDSFSVVATGK